jgi:hypothetical protein
VELLHVVVSPKSKPPMQLAAPHWEFCVHWVTQNSLLFGSVTQQWVESQSLKRPVQQS